MTSETSLACSRHLLTLLIAGGGGILVLGDIIVTDLVPLRFRGNFFSIFGAMWAIGSVSGPIVGGAFSQEVSWRWIFWINLPLLAVGVPMVVLFLKLQHRVTTLAQQLRRVDWIGMVSPPNLLSGKDTRKTQAKPTSI